MLRRPAPAAYTGMPNDQSIGITVVVRHLAAAISDILSHDRYRCIVSSEVSSAITDKAAATILWCDEPG